MTVFLWPISVGYYPVVFLIPPTVHQWLCCLLVKLWSKYLLLRKWRRKNQLYLYELHPTTFQYKPRNHGSTGLLTVKESLHIFLMLCMTTVLCTGPLWRPITMKHDMSKRWPLLLLRQSASMVSNYCLLQVLFSLSVLVKALSSPVVHKKLNNHFFPWTMSPHPCVSLNILLCFMLRNSVIISRLSCVSVLYDIRKWSQRPTGSFPMM